MTEKLDRLFRFDMYPHDWLIDTASIDAEECGVYIQIVMLIYAKRSSIPNDPSEIARRLRGLSTRRCRTLVDNLLKSGFLTLTSDGELTQKRAESELVSKLAHLERSSNGGVARALNAGQSIRNNKLALSGREKPLITPSPSPSPTAKDPERIPLVDNSNSGSGRDSIENGNSGRAPEISDKAIASARKNAPGWDMQVLINRWWNYASTHAEPVKNPDASFQSWVKRNIQGKRPP